MKKDLIAVMAAAFAIFGLFVAAARLLV